MENARLPAQPDSGKYWLGSFVVFAYEFLGTALLVGIVNCTKGNPAAVGLGLFVLLLMAGPITGAHFNPAVSIGVYINRLPGASAAGTGLSCTIQFVVMICGQIAGAISSMLLFYVLLKPSDEKKIADAYPKLAHNTELGWAQAMAIETICTGIFVLAVLLVKDSRAGPFTANVGEHGVGWLGCSVIASALAGMIIVAGPNSGASLNPAVSICQNILAVNILGLS